MHDKSGKKIMSTNLVRNAAMYSLQKSYCNHSEMFLGSAYLPPHQQ